MAGNFKFSRAYRQAPLDEKFHYNYTKKENGCWEWNSSFHATGYGVLRHKKKAYLGHTLSWELYHGDRNGLCVCHTCDNRKCVNPDHLFLGTRADNNADRDRKGRGPQGERNWCAKLTAQDLPLIFRMRESGMLQQEIADKFGVSQGAISGVLNKTTWKHL